MPEASSRIPSTFVYLIVVLFHNPVKHVWILPEQFAQLSQPTLNFRYVWQLFLQFQFLIFERKTCGAVQPLQAPITVAIELQKVGVEFPKRRSVGDGQKSDSCILCCLVHVAFNVNAHCAGALVQQRIQRPAKYLIQNYFSTIKGSTPGYENMIIFTDCQWQVKKNGATLIFIGKLGNKCLPGQFWPCLSFALFQCPHACPSVLISYLGDQSSGLSMLWYEFVWSWDRDIIFEWV